tara:strand:- start:1031 stop:1252 length:222 start_codon:yes stop_codon:yes gene_type:complete
MKLTKLQIKQIIKEELMAGETSQPEREPLTPVAKIKKIIELVDQAKMNKSLGMPDGRVAQNYLDQIRQLVEQG